MSRFDQVLNAIQKEEYQQRINLLEYTLQTIDSIRNFDKEDFAALSSFSRNEVGDLLKTIPEKKTYKEKDYCCQYAERILALITKLYKNKARIPDDLLAECRQLAQLMDETRPIEATVRGIFAQNTVYEAYVNRLLSFAGNAPDEYQKGKLYVCLLEYKDKFSVLDKESASKIAEYINSEIKRYLSVAQPEKDLLNAWEIAVDLVKDFQNDETVPLLTQTLQTDRGNVGYYALETLLALGAKVPENCVKSLSENLEYANLTYMLLKKYQLTQLFPAERSSKEYLAKSDLVHWLIYPTELGRAPEAIEYIGKIKKLFKKTEYYVFKYRSTSENLDNELRGKWLVGWSNEDGGTFSNFDLYSQYEKETVEKTLKNIEKKLIG